MKAGDWIFERFAPTVQAVDDNRGDGVESSKVRKRRR